MPLRPENSKHLLIVEPKVKSWWNAARGTQAFTHEKAAHLFAKEVGGARVSHWIRDFESDELQGWKLLTAEERG